MKKKCCIFAIVGIILIFSIMLCIHIMNTKNLDSWIGEYHYVELFPQNCNEMYYSIDYTVIIYKEGNEYYAQITGDGWQTMIRMLARVTGNQDKIEISFLKLLPDSMNLFDEGEVIWRFERDGDNMNTVWLEGRVLYPYWSDSEGEIVEQSFEKVEDQ